MQDRLSLLRNTYLFAGLSAEQLSRIDDLMESRSLRPQSTVYREGDADTSFYVVESGRLKAWARDDRGHPRVLSYLLPGDSFGKHALLTGQRRDATVEAEEASELLCLHKQRLDRLLEEQPPLRQALHVGLRQRLAQVPFFSRLSDDDLQTVAQEIGEASYPQGTIISSQGEMDPAFYVLDKGRVSLTQEEASGQPELVRILQPGDFFGERGLLTGQPRRSTARALEDSRLLYISPRHFTQLMQSVPALRKGLDLEAQASDPMLSKRLPWQREGETLLFFSRKHPYAFFRRLWVVLLALGGAAVVLFLAFLFGWSTFWAFLVSALLAAASIGLCFWLWLDWRNDYYAVTNKRVVHLEKTILVRESREEAPLESIQDISVLTPSVTARLFGFDDLSIQTAGTKGRVVFKTVGNAAWLRDRLFQQLGRVRADGRTEERESIRQRLQLEFGRAQEALATVALDDDRSSDQPGSPAQEATTSVAAGRPRWSWRGYLIPHMRLEEDGVVTWRKHWFRLVDRIAGPVILLFIMSQLAVAARLGLAAPPPRFQSLFWPLLAVGIPLGLFLTWFRYEDWRNDVYQLTEDRIIDVERLPLGLREERREASLAMIQDIGYEIPGVIANLLNYGNVVIETAGREAAFTFSWVHQPRRVQQEVFSRMDAFREKERLRQKERRAEELLDWFATYSEVAQPEKSANDQEEK
jgi:CRP-like cAMP-binding protein/uncharacterized membrane protein YdbT with pleckstrin-like domain